MERRMLKKIVIIGVFLMSLFVTTKVFAVGSFTVSKTSISVTEGATTSFNINGSKATGRVDIKSSNSSVASVSSSSIWLENNSSTIKITGKKTGSATITVSGTVADTEGVEAKITRTIQVTVKAKTTTKKTTSTTPSKSTTSKNTTTKKEPAKVTEKKEETKKVEEAEKKEEVTQEERYLLKSLEIEEGVLSPAFNSETFEYTVKVVDKDQLVIKATPNQEGLFVETVGNENLQVGENTISLLVKGQDDKEITTYKITVMKEKSELTLANEKIQALEKNNTILKIVIIALGACIILIGTVSFIKMRTYKTENKE